jgi:DNA (cytosine-5)-methyltransferase 1
VGITKCKSKNKSELITLLRERIPENTIHPVSVPISDKMVINESPNQYNGLRFIDLFCGIGGFHQALTNMNCKCVFACDIDEECRKTYEENYRIKPHSDITKLNVDDIPPFDILCAGFPCQPFSKAGFQKGFDDDRGNLFFILCNIIKKHNPTYLLLENVRNLSSHDEGNTWKVIYENIDALGYYTYKVPVILNALHFNIPQNRERVIIMCKRKNAGELPPIPSIPKTPKLNLTKHIKDFICNKSETEKYKINGKLKEVETVWNAFIKIIIQHEIHMPKFPIWTDWWDNSFDTKDVFYIKYKSWIDSNREFFERNKSALHDWLIESRANTNWIGAVRKFEWQAGDLLKNDGMDTVLWTARGSGIRVKRCDYIPTLVAMSMIPIYGPESRKLTARELLRLQSFPDTFTFNEKKIYKQVGNSVNVKMIEQSARFLILNEPLL